MHEGNHEITIETGQHLMIVKFNSTVQCPHTG